jgi:cell division septum initiation protein DivIVA
MEELMDILHLIDRLEEILNESRPIPLTHTVLVDEAKVLDLIDQMRVAIPEEVKKAQQVLAQRDRILAQTQEEANRTLAIARDRSEQMVERESIVQAAQVRASDVGTQEIAKIQQIQQEADSYVIETLTRLEMELDRMITQVRNGIATLQNDNPPPPV